MQMSRLVTAYFREGFPKLGRGESSVLFNSISAVEETVTTKTTMIMSVLGRDRVTGKGGGVCEPHNFHQAEREHFKGIAVPPHAGRSEIARCISPHSRDEARLLAPL